MALGPSFCICFSNSSSYFLSASISFFLTSYSRSFLSFSFRYFSINFLNFYIYFYCYRDNTSRRFLWISYYFVNIWVFLRYNYFASSYPYNRDLDSAFNRRYSLANASFLSFLSKTPPRLSITA
jgi:hypothetical protein